MLRCTGSSLRPWLPGEVVADDGEEPPGPQHPGRLQVQGGGRAEVVERLHGALEPATGSRAAPGTRSPGPRSRPPLPACSGRTLPCTRCWAPSWPPRCGGREEPGCCKGETWSWRELGSRPTTSLHTAASSMVSCPEPQPTSTASPGVSLAISPGWSESSEAE